MDKPSFKHFIKEENMNKDQLKGNWHELKGKIKEKWGKLTDDDLTQINGKKEQLLGFIQKKYGYAKEKAQDELALFEKKLSTMNSSREESNDMEESSAMKKKQPNGEWK
jgi:uncharacterized protein YjbJ (UPF0337 family)